MRPRGRKKTLSALSCTRELTAFVPADRIFEVARAAAALADLQLQRLGSAESFVSGDAYP